MQLNITSEDAEAYQNFLDSIRDKGTLRKYDGYLKYFLELIPSKMYKEYLGYEPKLRKIPKDPKKIVKSTDPALAGCFVELAQKNIKVCKSIIKSYVRDLKQQIENKEISAGTAKNRLKPIKSLLKSNEVEISWYMVDKSLPKVGKSTDRAYTREELQNMMIEAVDLADKIIITAASSGGFRIEAWDYFTWDDYIILKNKDGTINGGALRVYRGDIEEYWTHITPEACKYLSLYKEEWKNRFLSYPKNTDPLLVSVRSGFSKRLQSSGVKSRTENFVSKIGIRPKLENGQKRHAVMLDHGFRKYQNTMLRRAKVDFADKEDMQGRNPGGQEGSYERYEEADFERFPEYKKAIPFLTISEEDRAKFELMQKQQEITELEEKKQELEEKNKKINSVEKISQELAEKMRDITAQGSLTEDIKQYVKKVVLENLEE